MNRELKNPKSVISEIVILDSKSSDNSVEYAKQFDVNWIEQEFVGYGPQKRIASSRAKNDWILNLDADEVPTQEFFNGLNFFFEKQYLDFKAAEVLRDFILFGKKLRFGGASEQKKLRLFNRNFFDWNANLVHEAVVSITEKNGLKIGRISGSLLHYSWASTTDWLKVTDLRAQSLGAIKASKYKFLLPRFFAFEVVLRFFLEFVRSYFIRLGFLDGVPGFVFCFFMAFSHVLKLIKCFEICTNYQNTTEGSE